MPNVEDHAANLLPELADLPEDHRSGFVAVVGRPNVGKSTLINQLLGQKIAIVSPRPQTTRNRLLGILTRPDAQIIFIDTPGMHQPQHRLGEYMLSEAEASLPDADVLLFLVDLQDPPGPGDHAIANLLAKQTEDDFRATLLVLNKLDLLSPGQVDSRIARYRALGEFDDWVAISALQACGLDELERKLRALLPPGPRFFPPDQVTDQQERFLVAELIREQVLHLTAEEVPHAVAVQVAEFKQRTDKLVYISANILVERETQKPIILGKGGRLIKRIGQEARQEVEALLGIRVYLDLWVKVWHKWRKDPARLRQLGYTNR